jgi:hypothetical protein
MAGPFRRILKSDKIINDSAAIKTRRRIQTTAEFLRQLTERTFRNQTPFPLDPTFRGEEA